jgi:hypothetical protein
MSIRDEIDFHAGRALEELECARRATCEAAAIAHIELSELHLARIRTLGRSGSRPALRLVDVGAPEETRRDWKSAARQSG